MCNTPKKLASTSRYVSPAQLPVEGFETPFERSLNPGNRWIVLAQFIPWDGIVIFIVSTLASVSLVGYLYAPG